jgi:hypothetical protein
LPGLPGSVEFNQAYEAALARHSAPPPVIGAGRIRPGTITALAIAYFNSPPFLTLSSSTRKTYRAIIEAFTAQHGDKPLTLLTRQHLNAMLARKVETPAAANHFAVAEGMRTEDPTIGIAYIGRHSSGFHTWTEDEIGQFEATHQIGGPARLALGLLLFTAQRCARSSATPRPPIRNAWHAPGWRRSFREHRVATQISRSGNLRLNL